jgi:hypothetical protein
MGGWGFLLVKASKFLNTVGFMTAETLQPYGPLHTIADGLWTMEGQWYHSPFQRKMTLKKFESGIWVHNPFHLNEQDYLQIEQLGGIAGIVSQGGKKAMRTSFNERFGWSL